MGNIESFPTSVEQLKENEKEDNCWLKISEVELLEEKWVIQKFKQELESNTLQFSLDEQKIQKIQKINEKWNQVEYTLAAFTEGTLFEEDFFLKKELKYLQKEISSLSNLGPASYSNSVLELRLNILKKIHLAWYRHEKRKATKIPLPNSEELNRKADFVMNLFGGHTDKIFDIVLTRLDELPSSQDLSFFFQSDKQEVETEEMEMGGILGEKSPERKYLDYENSLIHILLTFSFEETKRQLNAIDSNTPFPIESSSLISSIPSIRLLQILQKHLLLTFANEENDPSLFKFLSVYTLQLIQASIQIVELALNVNSNFQHVNNNDLDLRVEFILKDSIFNHLVFSLLTSLCLIVSKPKFASFAYSLLEPLKHLLFIQEKLHLLSQKSRKVEQNYLQRLYVSRELQKIEVESPHNYYPNTNEEKRVCIPSATFLTITFDPRCNTETGNDTLQLYRKPGRVDPILTEFSGKPENWPKVPILVEGDTVYFHFKSNPFTTYWGYRCIVTGHQFEPLNFWVYDLERTVALLFRKCLRSSLVGFMDEEEIKVQKYLDSPLFRGGSDSLSLQESQFIDDFLESRDGSPAQELIKSIEKTIPPNPLIDRIGSTSFEVTKAIRGYILVLIKHLGLMETVMKMNRSPEIDERLKTIWLEGRKLRQWIGNERRRILLEQEEKNSEMKEEPEEIASYSNLGNLLLKKISFLLSLAPASQTLQQFMLDPQISTDSKTKSQKGYTNLRFSQDDGISFENWKGLMETWKKLHQSSKKDHEDLYLSIPSLITSFLKKSFQVPLEVLITRRRERAKIRVLSLNLINQFLVLFKQTSIIQDILQILGSSLRSLKDTEISGHYLCNLKSCSSLDELNMQSSFLELYNALLFILTNPTSETILRRLIVDALSVNYIKEDSDFLIRTFRILYVLSREDSSAEPELRKQCYLAFTFLNLQCIRGVREQESILQPYTNHLRKMAIDLLIENLGKAFYQFTQIKSQLMLKIDSNLTNLYYKEEKNLYTALFIFDLTCRNFYSSIISHQLLTLFFDIFHQGTPRVQRYILRIFRRIFRFIDPSSFENWNLMKTYLKKEGKNGITIYLFDMIGTGLYLSELESAESTPPLQNYRTGQVNLALISEIIMLIRSLLELPSWHQSISNFIYYSLKSISSLVNVHSKSVIQSPELIYVLAALAVIGGHTDVMRVGGRVKIKSSKEKGTLVYYDRMSAQCKVIIDSDLKQVIVCDVDKLEPLTEVVFNPKSFHLLSELITSLLIFTEVKEEKYLFTPKKKDLKQQEIGMSPKLWSCSVCTYDNEISKSVCSMCRSSKPGPTCSSWECSVCTLINQANATYCSVCQSPKPKQKSEEKQRQLMEIEDEADDFNADLSFHQFHFRAVKALCCLLQNSNTILAHGFPQLLRMASSVTKLEEFKSVEQLEAIENRLLELIYQRKQSMVENLGNKQSTQAEILKFSPFSKLPIILPSFLDRSSARRMIFVQGDPNIIAKQNDDPLNMGIARANCVIPTSIPSYYFEIEILPEENSMELEEPTFAIGLYREGCELDGTPGNSNSFALDQSGRLLHNIGSLRSSCVVDTNYTSKIGVGDVIGCVWNIKNKTIYFTKNAQDLGTGFEGVVGRFYPVVWVGHEVMLKINWGQNPFIFDFNSKLPEGYLSSLADAEETTKVMSNAEIRRRALAEELVLMMDIFPLELCIVALEKCKDDLQYAANWLLENGFKEMERMASETLSRSKREDLEREERMIMLAVMKEQRELGQFDHSVMDENESKLIEDQVPDAEEEEDYENDSREPTRFLDDEIGQDAPIQIEKQRNESQIEEELEIGDIFPGMLLSVCNRELSQTEIFDTYGKTGEVIEVDLNTNSVKLRFFNAETSSIHELWFSFQHLQKPMSLWKDPSVGLNLEENKSLLKKYVEIEEALSILLVRRAVFEMISESPHFPFEKLVMEDSQTLINLLKLAAAEFLSSNISLEQTAKSPVLNSFYDKLSLILQKEETPKISQNNSLIRNEEPFSGITHLLVEECIKHFTKAVEYPPPILTEESPHPYENNRDERKKLHIPGASKLVINFNPNTSIHKSDPLTRISFYRDQEYQDLIVTYRGAFDSTTFQPIIVDGDQVWFRFTSGPGERFWGYKFTVSPLELRLNDIQALNGLNFELGYWLFDLLLEKGPSFVKTMYIKHLYDSLVFYIKSSKRSAKKRGIQLLLRVLQILRFSKQPVDLTHLLSLNDVITRKYHREVKDNNYLLFSEHLQSLVELFVRTKLTEQVQQKQPESVPSLEKDSLSIFDFKTIRIVSGSYGTNDVTKELQQMVDKQFGGCALIIPAQHSLIDFLADSSQGNRKKLTISFEILQHGLVIESSTQSFKYGELISISTDTWLYDLIQVTALIESQLKDTSFTTQLLIESLLNEKLTQEYFYPLVSDFFATSERGLSLPNPGPFVSFTITFNFLLSQDKTGKPRIILMKGLENSRTPALFLDGKSRKLLFQVTTTRDTQESCLSKTEIELEKWATIICWCDSKRLRIYINGHLDSETKLNGRIQHNNYPIFLNKPPLGTQDIDHMYDGVEGCLQNMRLYLRPLSEKEMIDLLQNDEKNPSTLLPPPLKFEIPPFQNWTLGMDEQLVELASLMAEEKKIDLFDLTPSQILPNPELIRQFPLLSNVPLKELKIRFLTLKSFNIKLANVFPMIDFSQSHLTWSLAHSLIQIKSIIFLQTKMNLWMRILYSTNLNRHRPYVKINRLKALKAKEKGDPQGSRSVFGQLYRQLHFLHPSKLRRAGQTWTVKYEGEGGEDAGGLFRDCLSNVCSDLQSSYVPLLIKCPNASGFGDNQDKYIPNPGSTSSLELSMFSFLGKLMGVAIRGKHVLNLDLPSIVWKQLVQSPVARTDLEAIDAFSYKIYDQVMNVNPREEMIEKLEDLLDLHFTTLSSDGREIELIENGKNIPVTWENREQYVKAVEAYKLNEFNLQINSIRSGLATIIPIQLLSLFNWKELELMVCGKREVDIEFLRHNTRYSGYDSGHPAVQKFWNVLKTFSIKEKELFLRFSWGRSRLPISNEDFDQKFVLMSSHNNSDENLPVSHTCFFQLELPDYSTEEIMRKKLLYAITECKAIDTDYLPPNITWDDED